MSPDLRTLLRDTGVPPTRDLDPVEVVDTAERRVRRGRRWRVAAATGAVAVAAVAAPMVLGGGPELPEVADQPDHIRQSGPADAIEVPDGWVTVTAGELALSVPPDWNVEVRSMPDAAILDADDTYLGGPCLEDLIHDDGPAVVVYDHPTDGACRAPGLPPPPHPAIVLYEAIRGDVDGEPRRLDGELVDIDERAVRERVGAVEVWRYTADDDAPAARQPSPYDEHDPLAEVVDDVDQASYVAADLVGGLWVAHADAPVVQEVLATLRPVDSAVPRPRSVDTRHRTVPDGSWQELGAPTSSRYMGAGYFAHTQEQLDDQWGWLGIDDPAPTLPDGMVGIAAQTYAGGLPGGCHQRRAVVEVQVTGDRAALVLGPLADGEPVDACSQDPFIHVVAVDATEVEGVEHAGIGLSPGTAVEIPDSGFQVLATGQAEPTDMPAFVVPAYEDVHEGWRAVGGSGDVADPPDGWLAVVVVTEEETTCGRDPADVVGVEIVDGTATVLLDAGGQFARPCPGPPGSGAPTAFAVAIAEEYTQLFERAGIRIVAIAP